MCLNSVFGGLHTRFWFGMIQNSDGVENLWIYSSCVYYHDAERKKWSENGIPSKSAVKSRGETKAISSVRTCKTPFRQSISEYSFICRANFGNSKMIFVCWEKKSPLAFVSTGTYSRHKPWKQNLEPVALRHCVTKCPYFHQYPRPGNLAVLASNWGTVHGEKSLSGLSNLLGCIRSSNSEINFSGL